MIDTNNQTTINLRFPGQYYDQETGLHYNYFRDYNPNVGRYIQSDPIGLSGGINTFTYAAANPLYWTDSMGLALDTVSNWCRRNPAACIQLGFGLLPRPNPGPLPNSFQPENCPGGEVAPGQQPYFPPIFTSNGKGDNKGGANATNNPATAATGGASPTPPNNKNDKDNKGGKPREEMVRKPKLTGKEKANNVPEFARGKPPFVGEKSQEYATRIMNEEFGKGGWADRVGQGKEWNQIQKSHRGWMVKPKKVN